MAPLCTRRIEIEENESHSLKVACWNCGGNNLHGRINEIKALLSINKLDILGIVECCLKAEYNKMLVNIEGYDLLVEGGISVKKKISSKGCRLHQVKSGISTAQGPES